MFVVIGRWRMNPEIAQAQREGLDRIVAGVGQLPHLVKGYWTTSDDGSTSHTFIVFDDRPSAEEFAGNVRGNVENQRQAGVENISLDIDEVVAQT
jgi:hypothetical protein